MKSTRTLLLIAAGIVIAVNLFVLAGVAWNRSGTPESQLSLNQRELHLPSRSRQTEENTGLALVLQWSALAKEANPYSAKTPAWLDQDKLRSLGFSNFDPDDTRARRRESPREALLVLELAGPAYHAAVQQAEKKLAELQAIPAKADVLEDWRKRVTNLKHKDSRLYAVDAGLELDALRHRYPNRQQYAIVPALIGWNSLQINRAYAIQGHIRNLPGEHINLPSELRAAFEKLPANNWAKYHVEIAFGQRLEPWIINAQVAPKP